MCKHVYDLLLKKYHKLRSSGLIVIAMNTKAKKSLQGCNVVILQKKLNNSRILSPKYTTTLTSEH
jgi:hypothetical protein